MNRVPSYSANADKITLQEKYEYQIREAINCALQLKIIWMREVDCAPNGFNGQINAYRFDYVIDTIIELASDLKKLDEFLAEQNSEEAGAI